MIPGITASSQVRGPVELPHAFLAYAKRDGTSTSCDVQLLGTAKINNTLYTTGTHSITLSSTPMEIRNDGDLGEDLTGVRWVTNVISEIDIQNGTMLTSANLGGNDSMCFLLDKLLKFNAVGLHNCVSFYAMFYECYSLTEISLGDAPLVTTIGSMCYNNSSLTSFEMGLTESLDYLWSAWWGCSLLESLPAIVSVEGCKFNNCFYNCFNLVCLTSINTIGYISNDSMFNGCSSLTSPNSTEQSAILAGSNYINPNPCP